MRRNSITILMISLTLSILLVGCGGKTAPPVVSNMSGKDHSVLKSPAEVSLVKSDKGLTAEAAIPSRPAVSEEERMKVYPSPGEYVAFSLQEAKNQLTAMKARSNYRTLFPEIFNLGGMNHIHGLVYDKESKDMILVGKYDPDRQPITLDDFVVALRARFIHGTWPVVSIDPTEKTKTTSMQNVRFEGGIENTQFGQDLLEADYRLKRIGMGLLASGISHFKSYWDLEMERLIGGGLDNFKTNSRFWFYPVLPSVSVRQDVVAIKGLKVGIFTEALSAEIDGKPIKDLATFQNEAAESFAKTFSDRYAELAMVHPSFSRVQGLDELVALTRAIEEIEDRPALEFWLQDYRIKLVETRRELKVLRRKSKDLEVNQANRIYRKSYTVSGGIKLMAIALRLNAGDVAALKDAVLTTRPKPGALSWSFVVGEWVIPTSPKILRMENIAQLFSQAEFLRGHKRYDEAITLYEKILEVKPDLANVYINRGAVYYEKRQLDQALTDFDQAITINPRIAEAFINRGLVYSEKGQLDRALADCEQALTINPKFAEAFTNRGLVYSKKGQLDRALSDYDKALAINPRLSKVYSNRGAAYAKKEQLDKALTDFDQAITINPRYVEAYLNRGMLYKKKGQLDQALADYAQVLAINPGYAEAYFKRGIVYAQKGLLDQALADYDQALAINPGYADAYNNRGWVYIQKRQLDQAVADCDRALAINPKLAETYFNRGIAYAKKEQLDKALADFNQALVLNFKNAIVYYNRGLGYYMKRQLDQALADFDQAITINPGFAEAYSNRGVILMSLKDNRKACSDLKRACKLGKCENFDIFKRKGICP